MRTSFALAFAIPYFTYKKYWTHHERKYVYDVPNFYFIDELQSLIA